MATFELTTNAGQRYQIDADTPEAAQKAFDSQFGGGGFNQRLGSFATGANDLMANVLGTPGDAFRELGNLGVSGINAVAGTNLQPVERSWFGRPAMRDYFASTVGRTTPQDEADRLLYGGGAGAAAALGGMGVGGALQAAGKAPQTANVLLGGAKDALSALYNSLVVGGAGGAGSVGGRDVVAAAGGGPLAQELGGMAGGFGAGAAAATPGAAVQAYQARGGATPTLSAAAVQDAASGSYDAVRGSGLNVRSSDVADTARDVAETLRPTHTPPQPGLPGEAPNTYGQLAGMLDPIRSTTPVSELVARRQALTNTVGKGGSDSVAAIEARDALDKLLENLDSTNTVAAPGVTPTMGPQAVGGALQAARQNYLAAQNANRLSGELDPALTGFIERAEGRAQASPAGRTIDYQMRQRAEAILENNKQFRTLSPEEEASLIAIRDGGFVRNRLNQVGNWLGGATPFARAVSGGFGGGAGYLASGGNPYWATVSGMLAPIVGGAARLGANALARRSVNAAERVALSRAPYYNTPPLGLIAPPAAGQYGSGLFPGLLGTIAD